MSFQGIEPGQTLKSEAEKILGPPINKLPNNVSRYSITGKAGNVSLDIQYNNDIVDLLAVNFNQPKYNVSLTNEQSIKLFGLKKIGFTRNLDNGDKLEGFNKPEYLALGIKGSSAANTVNKLIYLSPRQYYGQKAVSLSQQLKISVKKTYLSEADFIKAADFYFSQAKEFNKNKDYTGAYGNVSMAYKLFPANKEYQSLMITLSEHLGFLDTTEDVLNQVLLADPSNINYREQLGLVLCKQNRLKEAEKCFQQILDIKPNDARALSLLSWIRKKQNRIQEALEYINKSLATLPNDAVCLNRKGCCLKTMGKYEEALEVFQKAIKANPDLPQPYLNMAEIYETQDKNKQALQSYKKLVEVKPTQENINKLADFKKKPSVEIKNLWVDHNAYHNKEKGILIHLNLLTSNMQHEKLWAAAFFTNDQGKPVTCNDVSHIDSNGETRVIINFKPGHKKTTYKDFTLFFPYRAFAPATGKYNYKCEVEILKGSKALTGDNFNFTYTQKGDAPRATINTILFEHNYFHNNKKGVLIHVKFQVDNLQGKKIDVNAFFRESNDLPVLSAIPEYTCPKGQATVQIDTVSQYKNSTYKDFQLFFPYYAFFTYKGKYSYTCEIEIKNQNICMAKDSAAFDFNRD